MQEGVLSLMQMAKTSAAIAEVKQGPVPFITILTNPTTGGVSASFAMQGDVVLAEPGAVIGFAGQRVIKQTIGQDLPEGFQTAEFLLEHGQIDDVVARPSLRETVARLIRHMSGAATVAGGQ
jgi:acetyl-CoA carboxylase carboxyl transferase subunit beta